MLRVALDKLKENWMMLVVGCVIVGVTAGLMIGLTGRTDTATAAQEDQAAPQEQEPPAEPGDELSGMDVPAPAEGEESIYVTQEDFQAFQTELLAAIAAGKTTAPSAEGGNEEATQSGDQAQQQTGSTPSTSSNQSSGVDSTLQGSGTLDLSNPLALPDFIDDANDWKYVMAPEDREAAVSAALSTEEFTIVVHEVEEEAGVAYTFNAKGIALADLPLIQELLYHAHLGDDRLAYFAGDGSTLSEHDTATGDTTVRIFYYLAALVDWRGEYCRIYWNAVQHDTRNDRTTIPYGYFKDVCLPVPEVYISYPDLVPTFEFLMEVAQAGLNPLGERDGVWFFYSSLGSQSVTCPEGWTCYGTTDPVGGNPEYVLFTGTMDSLNAVWVLDTVDDDLNDVNMSTSEVAEFITDYRINVK